MGRLRSDNSHIGSDSPEVTHEPHNLSLTPIHANRRDHVPVEGFEVDCGDGTTCSGRNGVDEIFDRFLVNYNLVDYEEIRERELPK